MTNSCCECSVKIKQAKSPACKHCKRLFHLECVKYGVMINEAEGVFACNKCVQKHYTDSYNKPKSDPLQLKIDKLTQELSEYKLVIETMKKENSEMFENFRIAMENFTAKEVGSACTCKCDDTNVGVEEVVRNIIRDERQREKKKLNLCIRGFPHNGDGDLEAFRQLCAVQLNISDTGAVTHCRRVQAARTDEPKLMVVTVRDITSKKLILSCAHMLRDFKTPSGVPIYISPDLTKMERDKQAALRKELRERRAKGEAGYIRKNVIVPRNTPEQRVTRSATLAQKRQQLASNVAVAANVAAAATPVTPSPSSQLSSVELN